MICRRCASRRASIRSRHATTSSSADRVCVMTGGPPCNCRCASTTRRLKSSTTRRTPCSLLSRSRTVSNCCVLLAQGQRGREHAGDLLALDQPLDPPVRVVAPVETFDRLVRRPANCRTRRGPSPAGPDGRPRQLAARTAGSAQRSSSAASSSGGSGAWCVAASSAASRSLRSRSIRRSFSSIDVAPFSGLRWVPEYRRPGSSRLPVLGQRPVRLEVTCHRCGATQGAAASRRPIRSRSWLVCESAHPGPVGTLGQFPRERVGECFRERSCPQPRRPPASPDRSNTRPARRTRPPLDSREAVVGPGSAARPQVVDGRVCSRPCGLRVSASRVRGHSRQGRRIGRSSSRRWSRERERSEPPGRVTMFDYATSRAEGNHEPWPGSRARGDRGRPGRRGAGLSRVPAAGRDASDCTEPFGSAPHLRPALTPSPHGRDEALPSTTCGRAGSRCRPPPYPSCGRPGTAQR